jgi:hypothetical protein
MESVIKDWLLMPNVSLYQQSIVLSAIRGNDSVIDNDVSKKIVKKLRYNVLKKAVKSNYSYMDNDADIETVRELANRVNEYPIHFYEHLIKACEIIGFKHPDQETRKWFNETYRILTASINLAEETEEECDLRFKDEL